MMNSYFMEILIRERQQQILEKVKGVRLLRAGLHPPPGVLKKMIRRFREIIFVTPIRIPEREHFLLPTLSDHDSGSTS